MSSPRQHTPGPWTVGGKVGLYCDDVQITANKEPVAIAIPRRSYCIMALARRPPEELAANARLIASAPELLNLLTAAGRLEELTGENLAVYARTFAALSRAAIARATGGAAL